MKTFALALMLATAPATIACAQSAPAAAQREPDVIYVPTPQPVVDAMLKLAGVKKGDILYDLGSGDGRIPVTAARVYGIRATGIDIDPERIAEAKANVAQEQCRQSRHHPPGGSVPGRFPRRQRRHPLSPPLAQRKAEAPAARRAETRHAHRQQHLRHGRLEAGKDPGGRRPQHLSVDHSEALTYKGAIPGGALNGA